MQKRRAISLCKSPTNVKAEPEKKRIASAFHRTAQAALICSSAASSDVFFAEQITVAVNDRGCAIRSQSKLMARS